MANTGRWQAVEPEPTASRPEPQPRPEPRTEPETEPEPQPAVAEVAPPVVVDLVAAEQSDPPRAEATPGTVEIEAVLTEDEYQQLLAGAAEAGKTPNDFLRQAVRDAWFFERNTPPGSKILIVSGGKVHTVR
jgi:hypothetical protein